MKITIEVQRIIIGVALSKSFCITSFTFPRSLYDELSPVAPSDSFLAVDDDALCLLLLLLDAVLFV